MSGATRTQVAIVGGGPAGLLVSHLLHRGGVQSVVLDTRSVHEIETTHRAGILEQGSVGLLVDTGVSDRVHSEGHEHRGIRLRFDGNSHLVDFQQLVGASTWLYPQTEVFRDLHAARSRDGGDLRYGLRDTTLLDLDGGRVGYRDEHGEAHEVHADVVVGSDGSRSSTRQHVPGRDEVHREYPFAWFGVLVEAPPSASELIYTRSPRGFALISQRTDQIQRMYFQCDPAEDAHEWSDDRIWEELQARLAGDDGFALQEGPVLERTVLPFRSFVQTPMQHGPLALAGDAAHTVPPTGAKGLNLALADAALLAELLVESADGGDVRVPEAYTERALRRVWKAQHFSYWMTTMLHRLPDASAFDERRQLGELQMLVASEWGARYLAEGYTGWPRS